MSTEPTFADDEWSFFKRATRDLDDEGGPDTMETDDLTTYVGPAGPWLPPAVNVHPRRRRPRGDWTTMSIQLYCFSYPASPSLQSILNPWGEQPHVFTGPIDELSSRILAACEVYRYQNVHFDGYLDSEDDGQHLFNAADGRPYAWFGDNEAKTYRRAVQSLPDTLDERCWICVDLPIFALNLAGFPIRRALLADFLETPNAYLQDGRFPGNVPINANFFRRAENLRRYFRRRQFYSHDRITVRQYLDPDYRPHRPFRPGDVIFMGHWHPTDNRGPFEVAKHSGIVESVDERGMPVRLYNMRTSNRLLDRYDAVIGQTRTVKGRQVYMHRFYDRYSIIGHGRIVELSEPEGAMPTLEMAHAWHANHQARLAARATSETMTGGATVSEGSIIPAQITAPGATSEVNPLDGLPLSPSLTADPVTSRTKPATVPLQPAGGETRRGPAGTNLPLP